MDEIHNEVVGMSYHFFYNKEVNAELIWEFIDRMQKAFPEQDFDREWLFRKLETMHSIFIGSESTLDDKTGHEEWFNPATNTPTAREFPWHFWAHYREYLIKKKGWPPIVVDSVDRLSSEILSRIEDPTREDEWDRRGMVMGSVQSGKTANYTALITKAADAGYKFFIVLAGVHNSLRSQTQSRLNEEFLGYDIDRVQKATDTEKRIGVRSMFKKHDLVYTLTSSNEAGDFKSFMASRSGIPVSANGPPIILVIKKNVSILKNLVSWASSMTDTRTDEKGLKKIFDVPIVVIDDECDYASINTKKPDFDADTGKINDEWDPTKTNMWIRTLLTLFDKSIYIGYTATPYANIFIHGEHYHEKYGDDVFPKSFIINLPPPSNYIGPERVFGLDEELYRGVESVDPLPLIRQVDDHHEIIPDRHKKTLFIETLPESLKKAIKRFLLSCAARSIRKEGNPHNSMLIHVTRYVDVQGRLYQLISSELSRLTARIMNGEDLDDFKKIWERDFIPTTRKMKEFGFNDAVEHTWEEIEKKLYQTTRLVVVKQINGTAMDSFEYKEAEDVARARKRKGEKVKWEETGRNIIAIGGDKLSRGLTLEGLTVSYYLRATKMYDTLMQMGRWFGYREGYNDLCRMYTTGELISWYRHIAGATKELREEIEYMAAIGETPENFGLKVRSHPSRLVIPTSAAKSRNKELVKISFAGTIKETVVFDENQSKNNKEAVEGLLRKIGRTPKKDFSHEKHGYHWSGISSDAVINFLFHYKNHKNASRVVDPQAMAKFIERQNKLKELVKWDVLIVTPERPVHSVEIREYDIGCLVRTPNIYDEERISIGRLVNPRDEACDLSKEEIKAAYERDDKRNKKYKKSDPPSGIAIRETRPPERGLLIIYFITGTYQDTESERTEKKYNKDSELTYGKDGKEIVGIAVSFPRSEQAIPIDYWVNPVYAGEEIHYT